MLTSTTRRAQRIERRCIPPVVKALHSGQISARSADLFLRLSPKEQALELQQRLDESAAREARHQVVAGVIRTYLDGLNGRKVDLIELSRIIKEALV
jgi:hypothetical protein